MKVKVLDLNQNKIIKLNKKDAINNTHKLIINIEKHGINYLNYSRAISRFIKNFVDTMPNDSDKPIILHVILTSSANKEEKNSLYSIITSAFVQSICTTEHRDREHILGVPNSLKKLNMQELNIKKLLNYKTKSNIIGLQVKIGSRILFNKTMRLI